jgi:hypothetical protein
MNQNDFLNYINQPSNPTIPMQDKFGQSIVFFGLSKLEYMAAIIAAGVVAGVQAKFEPEVIADESLQIAITILKNTYPKQETIIDGQKPIC